MKANVTILSRVIALLPRDTFRNLVRKHDSDAYSKGIGSWSHLVSMVFCHLGQCHSVRDISTGLRSITGNLNHLGVELVPSKSSVSYINAHRSWKLFRDYYHALLAHLRPSFSGMMPGGLRLSRKVFAVDSTLIPLCLEVFDWAVYRRQKGAVKVHTVLDFEGCLPVYACMTDGKTHDIWVARRLQFPKGSVVVADRAYVDFQWLSDLDSRGVFFVTRGKANFVYEVIERLDTSGQPDYILEDLRIRVIGQQTSKKYGKPLRLVRIKDPDSGKVLEFLTNNFRWSAKTVSLIYKNRWQIEVFFKMIKQHLKIKSFVGTSVNAVLIQIWTAMITILLLKYLQVKARYPWHLSNLVTFIRLNLFVKIDLFAWLDRPFTERQAAKSCSGQLVLFNSG